MQVPAEAEGQRPEENTQWYMEKQQQPKQGETAGLWLDQPIGTQENTILGRIHILCAEVHTE